MDQLPGEQSWSWQSENSAFQAERYCSAKCKKQTGSPTLSQSRCSQGGDGGSSPRSRLEARGCPVGRGRRKKARERSSLVVEREMVGREASFEQLLLLGRCQAVQVSFAETRKRILFFFFLSIIIIAGNTLCFTPVFIP